MSGLRLYNSKDWLKLQHYRRKRTIEEIADMCSVTPMTIRRAMEKFNMRISK